MERNSLGCFISFLISVLENGYVWRDWVGGFYFLDSIIVWLGIIGEAGLRKFCKSCEVSWRLVC